jgi:FkbM family methyltransferase
MREAFTHSPRLDPFRRVARGVRRARQAWSQHRTERRLAGPRIIRAFAETNPAAFFVEIGANDGEQHDHLRPILERWPWRGIMVEPVPYVFERLKRNYGKQDLVVLENAAIADRDGELPFYHLAQASESERPELPQWYDGIGSFSRDAVLNHAGYVPDIEQRLVRTNVPCLTFESLCRKHGVERVDLLLIDTEGYDHEILKNIDWKVHRPRLVVYEHYHLDPADRARTQSRLEQLGYEIKEEGFDTWCLVPVPEDRLTALFRALRPGLAPASVHEDR